MREDRAGRQDERHHGRHAGPAPEEDFDLAEVLLEAEDAVAEEIAEEAVAEAREHAAEEG